jgi:hypothetical protein
VREAVVAAAAGGAFAEGSYIKPDPGGCAFGSLTGAGVVVAATAAAAALGDAGVAEGVYKRDPDSCA